MLLWRFAENVINITPNKRQFLEDLVHHSLKLNWRILDAKWKKWPMGQLGQMEKIPTFHIDQLPIMRFSLNLPQVIGL